MISILLLSPVTMAHGGESFEQKVGRYFVDIGYDIPLTQGQETLLDIALYEQQANGSSASIRFTDVTLRIHTGSFILLEQSVRAPEFGKTFTTVLPQRHGHMTLDSEFFAEGILLERSSFDVTIRASEERRGYGVDQVFFATSLAVAFLFGIFILLRKKRFF